LNTFYLKPLSRIFDKRDISQASLKDKEIGMFNADSNVSIVLSIDFKSDGHAIWPALFAQLQPLRDKNWLTYYDGEVMYRGPHTIVGTGNTPMELVQSIPTERFVFFDAPLTSISDATYNYTNPCHASAILEIAI
jgi:hypothetical protein